jgi:regulator of RNase E activity RraA
VSAATVTSVLAKKGILRSWLAGPKPLRDGQPRVVGPAFTLRFIPAREDVTPESWAKPVSTRIAIEEMPAGAVVVADARGITSAATFGDILATRMMKRGVAGLVTDGAVRDKVGMLGSGLPIWTAGITAPAPYGDLAFIGWQEPIGCGGIAVFPNDIMIADDDGAVVIPAALAEEVARLGVEQEQFEAWVVREVEKGEKVTGLNPPNEATKARYEADRQKRR